MTSPICVLSVVVTSFMLRDVMAAPVNSLADTFLDMGQESPAPRSTVVRRSVLLEEIMGPLSRDVRSVDEHNRSERVYPIMRVLLTLLRYHLKGAVQVDIKQFINWDRTIQIDQLFYTKPKDVWQARHIILAARALGMRVRATGAGHSRSPLYVDEGNIMMDTTELQRFGPRMELTGPTASGRGFHTVTAVPGVRGRELNEFMTERGVATLCQAIQDQDTLGGMVSASSHGSTWDGITYSGIVQEVRLVDSLGRFRRFTKERHPDIVKAASCALGMFGIMYEITIKVEPTFVVKVENHFVPLAALFFNRTALKDEVTSNLLTEISWCPLHTSGAQVPNGWNVEDELLWLRTINKAEVSEYQNARIDGPVYVDTRGGSVCGGSPEPVSFHYVQNAFPFFNISSHGDETSAAFGLNIDNEFHRVHRALKFMVDRIELQIRQNGTSPVAALLPRFFKNHECFLCPSSTEISQEDDSGHTLDIDFLAKPKQPGFLAAAEDFVKEFAADKVRPHWGKRHADIPGMIEQIQRTYGSLLAQFKEMKRRSGVDPWDMFMNSHLLAVFGRSTQ